MMAEVKHTRPDKIREICHRRGIVSLFHFTRFYNLESILEEGLLPRSILERKPACLQPSYNDSYRYDGYKDAICLSVSYPNYKMLYDLRRRYEQRQEWVVIEIYAKVMWELKCAFCWENASDECIRVISLNTLKSSLALKEMFGNQQLRKQIRIPNHYPTSPQAEVLVFNSISARDYLKAVHFEDVVLRQRAESKKPVYINAQFVTSRKYFGKRSFKYT